MPTATLTFQLPEETEEFETANKAAKVSCAIHEYDNYLRARLKYETLTDEVYHALELARNKLHELIHSD